MSRLLVIGAGGHGRVVADTAREMGCWDDIAFLDERYPGFSKSGDWPVVGGGADAVHMKDQYRELIVAIGDGQLRLELLKRYRSAGFRIAVIVHPAASVSAGAKLADGTVVMAHAAVNYGAKVGLGGIINTGSSVDHDCILGDAVHVCPGAHLAGEVSVGDFGWVGIGASIVQQRHLGISVTIGAGAVVTKDIPNQATACGVPARVIKN